MCLVSQEARAQGQEQERRLETMHEGLSDFLRKFETATKLKYCQISSFFFLLNVTIYLNYLYILKKMCGFESWSTGPIVVLLSGRSPATANVSPGRPKSVFIGQQNS